MANLAVSCAKLGRNDDALLLKSQVLELRKLTLGDEHPDTLTSMNNLAVTYYDLGRLREAQNLMSNVVDIMKRTSPGHPDTLARSRNLAAINSAISEE